MMDLTQLTTEQLVDELSERCDGHFVIAYRYVDDGGTHGCCFRLSDSPVESMGLARVLTLESQRQYEAIDVDEAGDMI